MNFIQQANAMPIGNSQFDMPKAQEKYLTMEAGASSQGTSGAVDGLSVRGWMNRSPGAFPQPSNNGFGDGSYNGLGGGSNAGGGQGGFIGLINSLISQLSSLINGLNGENSAEGPGTQSVANGTFASTGDPHLSETGTALDGTGKSTPFDRHFDSMTGHDNLLSSQDINGGYRLSTAVSAPNANGITVNASATVHLNGGQDLVTLSNDGSASITSDGNTVSIGAGQIATLAGGENVTRNMDGSLTVAAQSMYGGSISTTLAVKGSGVDATANVQNVLVGGDIAGGVANAVPQRTEPHHRFILSDA